LEALSEELLGIHRGIFNGTELYMAWRSHVAKVIGELNLSAETRTKAETLWKWFDEQLS
jgi:hypothetical protein